MLHTRSIEMNIFKVYFNFYKIVQTFKPLTIVKSPSEVI